MPSDFLNINLDFHKFSPLAHQIRLHVHDAHFDD